MRNSHLRTDLAKVIGMLFLQNNLLPNNQLNLFLMFFTELMNMVFYIYIYSSLSIRLHKQKKTHRF